MPRRIPLSVHARYLSFTRGRYRFALTARCAPHTFCAPSNAETSSSSQTSPRPVLPESTWHSPESRCIRHRCRLRQNRRHPRDFRGRQILRDGRNRQHWPDFRCHPRRRPRLQGHSQSYLLPFHCRSPAQRPHRSQPPARLTRRGSGCSHRSGSRSGSHSD